MAVFCSRFIGEGGICWARSGVAGEGRRRGRGLQLAERYQVVVLLLGRQTHEQVDLVERISLYFAEGMAVSDEVGDGLGEAFGVRLFHILSTL